MIGFNLKPTEIFEKCREIDDFFSNYDVSEVVNNIANNNENDLSTILPTNNEICCVLTLYAYKDQKHYDSYQIQKGLFENREDTENFLFSPLVQAMAKENGFGEDEMSNVISKIFEEGMESTMKFMSKEYGVSEEDICNIITNIGLTNPLTSFFFKSEEYAQLFPYLLKDSSAFIDKEEEERQKQATNISFEDLIISFRACKLWTELNIDLYKDFMLFINNSSILEYKEAYSCRDLLHKNNNIDNTDKIDIIVNSFAYYAMCYDNKWKDIIWGDMLGRATKVKGFNLEFIKKLNKFAKNDQNGYVRIFCDIFKEYDPDSKLIDISRINWQDKILVRDTDKSHQKWFVKGTRLDELDERRLYQGLEKIWKTLADEEYIDEKAHNKELFIYRLSGINCPIDEKNKDTTLSFRGDDTLLGALVRCLYEDKDKDKIKHYTPPYKDIARYFNKGDKNLGTVGDKDAKNPSMARAINIVKNSGFSTKEDLEKRLRLSIDSEFLKKYEKKAEKNAPKNASCRENKK